MTPDLTPDMTYDRLRAISQRVNWRIDDIIGPDKRMDFSRPFLPETFVRAGALDFLTPAEQLNLNHIRGFVYLAMFELVERCILPVIEDLTAAGQGGDPGRTPALAQFAEEEAKHIELFVRFRQAFTEGFDVDCGFIGPAEQIGGAIRAHSPLALAIFVLGIEWATQRHYVESVQSDEELDPQFKSLLRHHWMEECQHAKLDALVFYELAAKATPEQIEGAVAEFLEIGAFIDTGLARQAELDLASLETCLGRTLSDEQRTRFVVEQHQVMRWTFLGSALRNEGFLSALGKVSPGGRAQLEKVAPAFC